MISDFVLVAAVATTAIAGCGDNKTLPVKDIDAPIAPPIDAPELDAPPDADPFATLAGTGLCLDAGCTQISPDVKEYVPRFQLWADTATKRRFVQLPPGTKIDTTDMDHWVFPVGTRLWKEFTRDGIRVETRFIEKRLDNDDLPNAWFYITYAWNASQDEAVATTMAIPDANGTMHDIPSKTSCKECHESLRPTRVLGFGALQLDFDSALLDLEDLIAGDLLTVPPGGTGTPRFPLPGNDPVAHDALGYLHANCGHCHNQTSPTIDVTRMDLRLLTTKLGSVAETPAFATSVDVDADVPFTENNMTFDKIIISGDPANSGLIVRMNSASSGRKMPKLGSEVVDPDGQTALVAWINAL